MIKKHKKIVIITAASLAVIFILGFGYKKFKDFEKKSAEKAMETQNKIDEQQSKIEELQSISSDQQQAEVAKNAQDEQAKKQECLRKIALEQEELESAKKMLNRDSSDLKQAESGQYEKDCLKKFSCSDKECESRTKKTCDGISSDNLKNRKSDVQKDSDYVKEVEQRITNIKNNCPAT